MSFRRNHRPHGSGPTIHEDHHRWGSFNRNSFNNRHRGANVNWNNGHNYNNNWSYNNAPDFPGKFGDRVGYGTDYGNHGTNYGNHCTGTGAPSLKRRKFSDGTWEDGWRRYCPQPRMHEGAIPATYNNPIPPTRSNLEASTSCSAKRDRSRFEDDEPVFMSRDEIERLSPSRKDGIDVFRETHLRYSYCAFIQNLGLRLEIPQTTIATAMVLCHRFFFRRSHASHDRFLISTAALFLAAKSEDTPCPLNNVLRASSEIFHKQDIASLIYTLPVGWFEQYRERVLEAEQMILTTLNFELEVQHPYAPLTSVLDKLGLSQTMLVNLALNLVSEGLRSSLWLQFKPQHIAAGAAYLASKFLNFDLSSYYIWQEFQASPAILEDVAQQLMELFY